MLNATSPELNKDAEGHTATIRKFRGFMKKRLILNSILIGTLAFSVQASPIGFTQIGDMQSGRPTSSTSAAQANPSTQDKGGNTLTVESLDHPEFVRLADGRLAPYGPGVICSDECVESEALATASGFPRKWLIALPIAGAAIVGVILATGDSPRPPRTAVGGVNQPPTVPVTPTPTPTPPSGGGDQPEPVPEPGTLALIGAGLAVMSRRRVWGLMNRREK